MELQDRDKVDGRTGALLWQDEYVRDTLDHVANRLIGVFRYRLKWECRLHDDNRVGLHESATARGSKESKELVQ